MTRVSTPGPDHPDIKIPPPLIYVVGLVVGWLLGRVWPLSIPRGGLGRIVAAIFLAAGVVLTTWSIGLFRRNRTAFVPIRPATKLVISGPYQVSRNPMYLALICFYAGLAVWFGWVWALILLPVVVMCVQGFVIAREEQYLETKFGEEYREYKARVRRWL